ncbi:TniQ family protein [Streptomyces sp. NPDC001634]|uniref:TniQ family protein n=1 Tax=Streptomyces sp. NPDC001634 TaxID=3154390 RepID=UPI0033231599
MPVPSAARSLRRLPVVPLPLPRESLLSWLGHLSAVYEVSRTSMATACGLLRPGDNAARIADSGPTSLVYGLGDEAVLRVEQATGLSGDELQAMTWMRFLGTAVKFDLVKTAPRNLFRVMKASWIDPREFKFCPSCVEENDGRWPLEWCTPWMFACLRHRCYLLAACPECHTPLPGAHVNLDQGSCHGSEKHRMTDVMLWRCGTAYKKWKAPDLHDEVLADLQKFLEERLALARPDTVQLRGVFADLAAMADFAFHVARPENIEGADPVVADGFTDFCTPSNQGAYAPRIAGPKPMAKTAALRISAQILFSGDPWSAARAIVDFAGRPLPVRALPLNQAWRKKPPQDTTRLIARIVESVRVAAPSVKGHNGRVLR